MDSFRQAMRVYEEAVAAAPTPRMYELWATFIAEALGGVLGGADADGDTDMDGGDVAAAAVAAAGGVEAVAAMGAELLGVCQRAHAAGRASERLLTSWVDWAQKLGQPKVRATFVYIGCALPTCGRSWAAAWFGGQTESDGGSA